MPSVAARTTYGSSSNPTSHTGVPYPASGVSAGDTLILIAGNDGDAESISAAGFTSIAADTGGLNEGYVEAGIFYRKADGTENGGTFTITVASNETVAAHIIHITGAADPTVTTPEVSTVVLSGGGATNPNPGARSVTGGPKDVLAIACAIGNDVLTPTGGPYSAFETTPTTAGSGDIEVMSDYSEIASTSSVDPGAFTRASGGWLAYTIVVHPSAAAASTGRTPVIKQHYRNMGYS